ncbi:MAG: hypothetical protein OEQ25_02285 [Gammaproteobacteria bacterium]|nr:hypothetical protein [Gammaproteobacteria bacterium]MDH3505943.1 hypothetical protein [Gammaproteobacteria bacterium]
MLIWLENTAYSQWILTGLTGWPLVLSMHAVGLAIAVGMVFAMNLRLLGLYTTIPLSSVQGLLGYAWIGIAINIFSGFSLFMTQASYYVTSFPFLVKISAIGLGIVALVITQKKLGKELSSWETGGISSQGRNLAIASLALWTLAVVTGRLIAYL